MHTFKSLGKLTKEEKESKWATTVSGSQAWALINEPFNLIRKKLGIENIHQSKYDFFSTSEKLKSIGTNAMANGTHYEEWVFSEVKNFLPNIVSEDICFQPVFPDGHRMKIYESFITSTPDFLDYNPDGTIKILGEIKCTTSAEERGTITERYYSQVLHNSYVMYASQGQLWAKNELTKPVSSYIWNFSEADFLNYEELLFTFFTHWAASNSEAYDVLSVEYEMENNDEPALQDLFIGENIEEIIPQYVQAKQNAKVSKSIVDKFEKTLKTAWQKAHQCEVSESQIIEMTVRNNAPKLNVAGALQAIMQQYQVPQNFLDEFMVESSTKTIKVKDKEE